MRTLINELECRVAKLESIGTMITLLEDLLDKERYFDSLNLVFGLKDLFAQYNTELNDITSKLYKKCG